MVPSITRSLLASFLLVTIAAGVASAQYRYPGPYNPYNPYSPYNPYNQAQAAGSAMYGAADLTRAQGDYSNQMEQARITREQALQEQIKTKRLAFDEMNYEKANTPSYTETLAKTNAQILQRLINNPTKSEISNGKTLNAMLPYVQYLSGTGAQGPPVPLAQSIINELNITGSGATSVGMLRAGGALEWPLGLQGPQQKKLDKLLPQAVDATAAGKLTPALMKEVRNEMKTMRATLAKGLQDDTIDGSTYVQALEFYNSLQTSVNALEKPDARKQLGGARSPRARNVQELVDYMTDNGLTFAAASPGSESAYKVTHDAFVRYTRIAQGSSGMQTMTAPPTMPSGKSKK
jgi:hypothetical protein